MSNMSIRVVKPAIEIWIAEIISALKSAMTLVLKIAKAVFARLKLLKHVHVARKDWKKIQEHPAWTKFQVVAKFVSES